MVQLHFGANAFSVSALWEGFDMEIAALKPAIFYCIQWEAEWAQIRLSHSYGMESGLLAWQRIQKHRPYIWGFVCDER